MTGVLRLCLPALFLGLFTHLAEAQIQRAPGTGEFWQKIRQIEMKAGQGREALLEAWPVPAQLQEVERSGQISSLEGGVVAFTPELIITSSEIRLNRGIPGLAILRIDGRCISVRELKQHYPDVSITDIPHSMSPEDKTYWSAYRQGGEIAFGFAQKRPECLANVVFTPKARPVP